MNHAIGFHSIGTGGMHALMALIESYTPESDPVETMYSVYRAKRVAEVAPGVGWQTDLGFISFDQKIKYFQPEAELIKRFDELYVEQEKARKGLITKAKLAKIVISAEREALAAPQKTQDQNEPKTSKE